MPICNMIIWSWAKYMTIGDSIVYFPIGPLGPWKEDYQSKKGFKHQVEECALSQVSKELKIMAPLGFSSLSMVRKLLGFHNKHYLLKKQQMNSKRWNNENMFSTQSYALSVNIIAREDAQNIASM